MLKKWDERRNFAIPGDHEETIQFAVQHWVATAKRAIEASGRFTVALSGGSTPKVIYQAFTPDLLDWTKVWVFFSDERSVPPDDLNSNYHMAMEAGFSKLPVPKEQIFRMKADKDIDLGASAYEHLIQEKVGAELFDLVMLGVGEDGHTASLFPNTQALREEKMLVVANSIPEKKTWRMSFTYPCINESKLAVIYALGKNKREIVPKVLAAPRVSEYPSSRIGTTEHRCLWILDQDAAELLPRK